ncbi:hypothetical protein BJ508DRAFT_342870 [Ascobolus immersus RN42]|uniref:Uncharacterized protein n=1 Tax=Ascobolus immersus RN42 TaxID=1160509 RepID=A0A3N4HLA4_ASCIM|nr:hypothetical protein BJ508DRAFT_342870 [Ascobolus immersus RN42]
MSRSRGGQDGHCLSPAPLFWKEVRKSTASSHPLDAPEMSSPTSPNSPPANGLLPQRPSPAETQYGASRHGYPAYYEFSAEEASYEGGRVRDSQFFMRGARTGNGAEISRSDTPSPVSSPVDELIPAQDEQEAFTDVPWASTDDTILDKDSIPHGTFPAASSAPSFRYRAEGHHREGAGHGDFRPIPTEDEREATLMVTADEYRRWHEGDSLGHGPSRSSHGGYVNGRNRVGTANGTEADRKVIKKKPPFVGDRRQGGRQDGQPFPAELPRSSWTRSRGYSIFICSPFQPSQLNHLTPRPPSNTHLYNMYSPPTDRQQSTSSESAYSASSGFSKAPDFDSMSTATTPPPEEVEGPVHDQPNIPQIDLPVYPAHFNFEGPEIAVPEAHTEAPALVQPATSALQSHITNGWNPVSTNSMAYLSSTESSVSSVDELISPEPSNGQNGDDDEDSDAEAIGITDSFRGLVSSSHEVQHGASNDRMVERNGSGSDGSSSTSFAVRSWVESLPTGDGIGCFDRHEAPTSSDGSITELDNPDTERNTAEQHRRQQVPRGRGISYSTRGSRSLEEEGNLLGAAGEESA